MGRLLNSAKEIIVGFVVGIAATLPGISGATLTVIFGIYERLIRDLADLKKWLMKDFSFLFLLAVGIGIGTVISAKLLNTFMDSHPAECLMLFIGLIVGQIPAIYATTGLDRDRSATTLEWGALALGLGIMAAMIVLDVVGVTGEDVVVESDLNGLLVMIVIGVIFSLASLLPGLSHSTLFIVFGLFTAFTAAVGDLIMYQIAGLALGVLIGLFAFSKLIHMVLERQHRAMMFLIFGLTVGSVASLLVTVSGCLSGADHIVFSAIAFVIGFVVSIRFMKLGKIEDSETE